MSRRIPPLIAAGLAGLLWPLDSRSGEPLEEPIHFHYATLDRGHVDLAVARLPPTRRMRAVETGSGELQSTESVSDHAPNGARTTVGPRIMLPVGLRADDQIRLTILTSAASGEGVDLEFVALVGRKRCTQGWNTRPASSSCDQVFAISELTGSPTRQTVPGDAIQIEASPDTVGADIIRVDALWSFPDNPEIELPITPSVAGSGQATLRFRWLLGRNLPRTSIAHLIEFRDGPALVRKAMVATLWGGSSYAYMPLSPRVTTTGSGASARQNFAASNYIRQQRSHDGSSFVVPDNGAPVTVSAWAKITQPGSSSRPFDMFLEIYRAERRADATLGGIPPGRPHTTINTASVPVSGFADEHMEIPAGVLSPGLWYLRPVSRDGNALDFSYGVTFGQATRNRTPRFGHYFNPARPGHGFSLAAAGNDWVLIWYAYDEAGDPLWFYAQGPKPVASTGGALWHAALQRVVWDGGAARFQSVGWTQLAATGVDTVELSWSIDGEGGSEPFQPLGPAGCPQTIAGVPLDVNGQWFSPAASGFGYSVQMIGDQEFYLGYLFDDQGLPRWLTAQDRFAPAERSIEAAQVKGFCISCAPKPTSRTVVGQLHRRFGFEGGTPALVSMGVNAQFSGGPVGRWSRQMSTARLGVPFGCR